MTQMEEWYSEAESEQTTNETTWQDALSKTANIEAGTYIVEAVAELSGSVTNKEVAARLVIDGVEINKVQRKPATTSEIIQFHSVRQRALSEGQHTLKIQFVSEAASQTAKIKRVRFKVEKL